MLRSSRLPVFLVLLFLFVFWLLQSFSFSSSEEVESLSISPINSTISLGQTQHFTVIATYEDHSTRDVTDLALYTSSNPLVALPTLGGHVTGLLQGTAAITATYGGHHVTTNLTVSSVTLVSLSATPSPATVPAGLTQPLTVTGHMSDGNTQSYTSQSSYTSANSSVATVDGGGLIRGVAPGSTTITIASGNISTTVSVTVTAPILSGISLTPATANLPAGQAQQYSVTGTYSDGSTQNLTGTSSYISSNATIATVDASGMVRGVAQGTATLTATNGGFSATATVTVLPPVLTGIVITPASTSVPAGLTQQYTVTGTYSDGSTQDVTASSTYTSSNTTVATIDAAGLGKGLTQGTATITATHGGFSSTATLTVTAPILSGISISPATTSVPAGLTQQYSVTGTYSDGSTQDLTASSTYTSSNASVATVDATGLGKGLVQGNVTITSTNGGFSATATLTVTAPVLSSINVTPATANVPAGLTQQYTVTGTYSDGSTQDLTTTSTFNSSNTTIATIDAAGLGKGLTQGTATITATNGGFTSTATLTVTAPILSGITLTPSTTSVAAGLNQQFNVIGTYSDGSTADLTSSSVFSSSNTTIATVDATGLGKGLAQGMATITATNGGFTSSAALTVTAPVLSSIAIAPATASAAAGLTQQFTVTGTYSDGSTADLTASSAYASSNAGSASVNTAGLATGVAQGSATITASYGGFTSAATFTVSAPMLSGIAITPSSAGFQVGQSQQLAVTGSYSDGSTGNLTSSAVYTSSNPSVATVNGGGLVTGVASGTATITATLEGISASALATVSGLPSPVSGPLPPDPATVAPPVDPTVATTMAAATAFLYAGANPIQTGVASGTINAVRVAVVRGKVLDSSNNPLPGVKITILNHPEYGSTLSRADGMFDMAVNGGGYLTVNYEKAGYPSAQRQVNAPWQDYVWAEDAIMVAYDTKVTTIDLANANNTIQVAQGSTVTDADGTRKATLLFNPGTAAVMVMPDGTTQPISTLNVRATEYTVGPKGPKAMPAPLPPTSGYTYCVELSVDEAVAAGASTVQFSQPIYNYVENFLNFPVGTIVPSGYYDKQKGAWIPSDNGKVIKILSVTSGLADIDIDGTNMAATTASMAAMGITDGERQQLASLYTAGQSLWRVPISHFTPWDHNWPYGPPQGAKPPTNPPLPHPNPPKCQDQKTGSIIGCEGQTLGEVVRISGTPFTLHYQSERTAGFKASSTLEFQLSGADVPANVQRIDLRINVAGQYVYQSFSPMPNQKYTFIWDGKDGYGRRLYGTQPVSIDIGYTYQAIYYSPAQFQGAFAAFTGIPMDRNTVAKTVTLWQHEETTLSFSLENRGFGGWSLDSHHIYDLNGRTLFKGDGSRIGANDVVKTLSRLGYVGLGPIAFGPDGSLYILAEWDDVVYRVAPNGDKTIVAGTYGSGGFSGDGGPAIQAQLSSINYWTENYGGGIAVGQDGSIYIADVGNGCIRRVGPDGIITTIAGISGNPGYSGDGGPALLAQFDSFGSIAIGPDGSLYVVDYGNNAIRRIGTDGIINTIAGGGYRSSMVGEGDGGPASMAGINLWYNSSIAIGSDGSIYFTETTGDIRRIGPDGIIATVVGGSYGFGGDGGPASQALISGAFQLALGPDGSIYFDDPGNGRIRMIGTDGNIATVAGGAIYNPNFVSGGAALTANIGSVVGMAMSPDGNLYINDYDTIEKMTKAFPSFSLADIVIPSEDGSELYVFDPVGKHRWTLDAKTKTVLFTFAYDANGLLIGVTDRNGNATTIQRDSAGNATAIIAPGGQRTNLTMDVNGYLATVSDPASDTFRMTYTLDGLLTSFTDPNGNTSTMTYDGAGRLIKDLNAEGGFWSLFRSENANSYNVTVSSGMGRNTNHLVENLYNGMRTTTTQPDGTVSSVMRENDGVVTTISSDGTISTLTQGPDPRFGMQAPVTSDLTAKTPSGLTSTLSEVRTVTLADPANPLSVVNLTDTVTLNGKTYTSVYDASLSAVTAISPAGRQTVSTLDNLGHVISSQVPGLAPVNYSYDAKGRLTGINQGARTTTLNYDSLNQLSSITDPAGRTVSFNYDLAGRVTQQTLPDGQVIGYTYDANGNVTSITPPGRPSHGFTYTGVNLESAYLPPNVSAGTNNTSYAYNLDKQLTMVTRPDGQTITMAYDAGGRLRDITTPTGSIGYAYDPTKGKLTTVTASGGVTLGYTYDGSLITGKTWSGPISGSVGYTYDNDFKVISENVNGTNPISFSYDSDGLLTGVGSLIISRNAQNGLLAGTTLGNITTAKTYNTLGELTAFAANNGPTTFFNTQYSRDNLGRITQISETINGTTNSYAYSYDTAGRLISATKNGISTNYTYDSNGNRLSNSILTATYDNQDRLLTYGGNSYTYTANGELQSKTTPMGTAAYNYDVLGNLLSATLPGGTVLEYVIDGQNRRIGKKVNGILVQGFLYESQLNPIAELDGAGNVVSRFVYGTKANVPDYMIKNGVAYRIISDHLGSPRLIIDTGSAAIVQQIDFDEFGNILNDTNPGFQPFGFGGGLYDQHTKLTRFGARDYDSETGRWTSKDTFGFNGGDLQFYDYGFNDPVNNIDPTGRKSEKPINEMDCEELLDAINEARNELTKRYQDMREDKNNLYPDNVGPDGTTWKGHKDQYDGWQRRLRKLLDQFLKGPCDPNMIPYDAWKSATTNAPSQPAPKFDIQSISDATGLSGAALAAYLIISEGSRIVFPARNFAPVL